MIRYIRHFAFHRHHFGSTMLDVALLLFVFFPLLLFLFPFAPFLLSPIYIFLLFHVPLFPLSSVSSCAAFPLLPLIPFVVVSSLLSVSAFRLLIPDCREKYRCKTLLECHLLNWLSQIQNEPV